MANSLHEEQQIIMNFNSDITRFIEEVNLNKKFQELGKLKSNEADFQNRFETIKNI